MSLNGSAVLTNAVRHGPISQNREGVPDFRSHLEGRGGLCADGESYESGSVTETAVRHRLEQITSPLVWRAAKRQSILPGIAEHV